MTDVGKVTVGVEINASGLGDRLAAKIKAVVAPAIAEVNKQLREVNRRTNDIDASGFAKLTAGARAAAAAVHSTGDASQDATRIIGVSIDRQVHDYERLADAAENAANRQIKAAARVAAAQTVIPKNTGGGEVAKTSVFGDLFAGLGGGSRFGASPVGLNLGALALGSLPAAATAATTLAGALQQVAQAGLVLPGLFGAIGSSVITATIGFQGLGDAVGGFWKAFQSGDPADLKKANAAIKHLAPNAQDVVHAVAGMFPAFRNLHQLVQQHMFAGISSELTGLAESLLPAVTSGLTMMSDAWNATLTTLANVGQLRSTSSMLGLIFTNTAKAQIQLNNAIQPITHAMLTLTQVGSHSLPRIASIIDRVARSFDHFISAAANSGALTRWINQGITGVTHLGSAFLNVVQIFGDLTRAAGGGGFLQWLDKVTAQLHTFLSSAQGQSALQHYFTVGKQLLQAWEPILKQLAFNLLPAVLKAARQWSQLMLPIIQSVLDVLGKFPDLLQTVLVGFLAFKSISPFAKLLGVGGLGGLNTRLRTATTKVGKLRGALGRLKGIAGAIGLGAILQGVQNPDVTGSKVTAAGLGKRPGLSIAEMVGGGAATGFAFGGLPGAALGAAGGLLGSQFQSVNLRQEQLRKFNQTLNAAKTPAAKQQLLNQFYGENLRDPRNLDIHKGGMVYASVLADMRKNPSKYGHGVTAGNAAGKLNFVVRNAKLAGQALDRLGNKIKTLPDGHIAIKNPTEKIIHQVLQLGLKVQHLPNGQVIIKTNTDVASNKLSALQAQIARINSGLDAMAARSARISAMSTYTPGQSVLGGAGATPGVLATGGGKALGGPITGGVRGRDSVPMLGQHGEHVLTTSDVARLGGQAGVYRFRAALQRGQVGRYAGGGAIGSILGAALGPLSSGLSQITRGVFGGMTTAMAPLLGQLTQINAAVSQTAQNTGKGGVFANVTAAPTLGSDFFGVSQVPGIGKGVNLLTNTLLDMMNIQVKVANTMTTVEAAFKQFRQKTFQAFNASGKLLNNTAALVDRSWSVVGRVVEQRSREAQQVTAGIANYGITKLLVPILTSLGQAGIQAGGAALTFAFQDVPGGMIFGPIIGAAVRAGGSALLQVFTGLLQSFLPKAINSITQLLFAGAKQFFPTLSRQILGGGFLAAIVKPLGDLLSFNFYGLAKDLGLFGGGVFANLHLLGGGSGLSTGLQTQQLIKAGDLIFYAGKIQKGIKALADAFGGPVRTLVGVVGNVLTGNLAGAWRYLTGQVQTDKQGIQANPGSDLNIGPRSINIIAGRGEGSFYTPPKSETGSTKGLVAALVALFKPGGDFIKELWRVARGVLQLFSGNVNHILMTVWDLIRKTWATITGGGGVFLQSLNTGVTTFLHQLNSGNAGFFQALWNGATNFFGALLNGGAATTTGSSSGGTATGGNLMPGNKTIGGASKSQQQQPLTGAVGESLNNLLGGIPDLIGNTLQQWFGFGGNWFDAGGMATGVGYLPKATVAPERVLSPRQTASFDRLVNVLERNHSAALGGNTTTIHAPFTVTGGSEHAAREARDRLLSLMS